MHAIQTAISALTELDGGDHHKAADVLTSDLIAGRELDDLQRVRARHGELLLGLLVLSSVMLRDLAAYVDITPQELLQGFARQLLEEPDVA
jgi:hypothetical protein